MEYFKNLNFEREPFSNTPDPYLFFNSKQHLETLQKLEISIRLKRGLNIVTGQVGTGKTTLSRQLIQKISHEPNINYFLILDPGFNSASDFLLYILRQFNENVPKNLDDTDKKEQIKEYLFTQGVDNNVTTVLLIDEGQKLPVFCLELLRELLNFETNDTKLLQIVIFAQNEFNDNVKNLENFNNRVNFRFKLSSLGFSETRALIEFRLEKSIVYNAKIPRFSFLAYMAIYKFTKGYPRNIINLCHHIMLALIIRKKWTVDYFLVQSCALKIMAPKRKKGLVYLISILFILGLGGILVLDSNFYHQFQTPPENQPIALDSQDKPTILHSFKTEKPIEPEVIPKPDPIASEHKATIEPDVILKPERVPIISENVVVIEPEVQFEKEPVSTIPEFYGRFKVPQKVTFFKMVMAVYGSYDIDNIKEILKSNPGIKNPDIIIAGMNINFPVIINAANDFHLQDVCILLSKRSDLKAAFIDTLKYQRVGVNARILPTWEVDKGFLFLIIYNRAFQNIAEANKYKNKLEGVENVICAKISSFNEGRKIL